MKVFEVFTYPFNQARALVAVILLDWAFSIFPNSHPVEKVLLAAALHTFARDAADNMDARSEGGL